MSKRSPQPIFNPGELDRTRKNLGPLSKEESMKMAALLGGKVGIEKEDEGISEKYARLRAQSRRRTDIPRPAEKKERPASASPDQDNGDLARLEPAEEGVGLTIEKGALQAEAWSSTAAASAPRWPWRNQAIGPG